MRSLRIVSILGARPQFIKAAPVSRAIDDAGHCETIVHTGQHYDDDMSGIFFRECMLREPDLNLQIGSGSHGRQTGQMLIQLEEALEWVRPDWVLVYGDTNSTLAGALASVKLQLPLAHVEAGLRSFNRSMPEEHNRVLTDHCADLLLCPTASAACNLAREGITHGVAVVGDTMFDSTVQLGAVARERSQALKRLCLEPGSYLLATVHRPYNTDDLTSLREILLGLQDIGEPVVFPVHPRTRKKITELDDAERLVVLLSNVRFINPVGYLDMLQLAQNARLILTDSGGLQKEAYFLGVPCITLRPETEWIETVEAGWNHLVGADRQRIVAIARSLTCPSSRPTDIFGDGRASQAIVEQIELRSIART